jgi:hypothetical protein
MNPVSLDTLNVADVAEEKGDVVLQRCGDRVAASRFSLRSLTGLTALSAMRARPRAHQRVWRKAIGSFYNALLDFSHHDLLHAHDVRKTEKLARLHGWPVFGGACGFSDRPPAIDRQDHPGDKFGSIRP